MQTRLHPALTLCLTLASLIITTPAICAGTSQDGSTPITQNTADAILKELKEIRKVLVKIEQQGGAGGRPKPPTTAKISTRGKLAMGSPDAPVTVVEFADYQCPFCLRFTRNTFPRLKAKYIDTGKVRWVALNLPLPMHKDATKAAQAAHCAAEQDMDKFWEMREELFANQRQLGAEHMPKHAEKLGLEMKSFLSCMQSKRHLDEIAKDAADAKQVRFTGTPSFIVGRTTSDVINGRAIIGAQPVTRFETTIDSALKAAGEAAEKS